MTDKIQPRLFNGTRDLLPQEMIPRKHILAIITDVFETYGFAPVETPVMEYLDVLLGKYGAESDKLVYPLAYKGGDVLGLRYDLTVPLSRLVAMNKDLQLPFKRYQIQPVYRGDRPQPAQGRFREFYQCDVDTVGTASLVADAENIAVCYTVFRALGLDPEEHGLAMRVNNRKLLRGLVVAAGLDPSMDKTICTALDKIEKIGQEKVDGLLAEEGIAEESRRKLFALVGLGAEIGPTRHDELLAAIEERLGDSEDGAAGVTEMRELFRHLDAVGVPREVLYFDLALTRGLDYYTGPIYEFHITCLPNFGSLGGGGRYDSLMENYGTAEIPATGVCIGLSRLQSALLKLEKIESRATPTRVLVLHLEDVSDDDRLRLASTLRAAGVPTEVFYDKARFKKQIGRADKLGIPFCVIQGPDELERGVVQVKDLRSGEQTEVAVADLPEHITTRT